MYRRESDFWHIGVQCKGDVRVFEMRGRERDGEKDVREWDSGVDGELEWFKRSRRGG